MRFMGQFAPFEQMSEEVSRIVDTAFTAWGTQRALPGPVMQQAEREVTSFKVLIGGRLRAGQYAVSRGQVRGGRFQRTLLRWKWRSGKDRRLERGGIRTMGPARR